MILSMPVAAPPVALPVEGGPDDEVRYAAVVARDRRQDGAFVYAVRTTGVYCRPSCGARTPLRRNVEFHATPADAAAAGFRACKRCRPDQAPDTLHRDVIAAVCAAIDTALASEAPVPTLETLAARAGYSPAHLHKLFRTAMGVTPRGYAAARRAERLRDRLPHHRTVSAAMHDAGYTSSSRLHAVARSRLGMAADRARRGGAAESIRFAVGATSLGALLVAATDRGICAIQFGDDPDALVHALEDRFPNATLVGDDEAFAATVARVVGLVEAPGTPVDLPLDLRGTAFQERVWRALMTIGPGDTRSYGEIAAAIGAPAAVRAVAQACAANPLAVAVPCHRVVRTTGALSGYRWGVERKAALLARERRAG